MQQNKYPAMVSIGLPVFNGGPILENAINSLLSQTYRNIELLISDNASTDETGSICERAQARDPRVKYHCNDTNIGAVANWHHVFRMASGEYFMWAAHDDRWEPEFIEEVVALLEEDSSAVLAFSQSDDIDLTTGRVFPGRNMLKFAKPRTRLSRLLKFLLNPGLSGKANLIYGVIRRDTLERVGCMYMGTYGSEEWSPTMLTLLLLGYQGNIAISDKVLFHKGFIPFPSLEEISVCSYKDIFHHYIAYKHVISENKVGLFKNSILQGAAIENFLRSLGGNIVERILKRLSHLRPVRNFYRKYRYDVGDQ